MSPDRAGLVRRLLTVNLIVAIVLIVALFFVPSYITSFRIVGVFTTANIFAMFAASWDILSGFTGQVNFGHAAFIGTGGFTVGLLSKYHEGVPAELQLVLGTLAAAALGVILGVPCLRLSGPYLALVTLTAASALLQLTFIYKRQTGGEEGISGIDRFNDSPVLGEIGRALAKIGYGPKFDELRRLDQATYINFYVVLLFTLLMIGGLLWLGFGRRGVVLRSIQQDEMAAQAAGVPITRYKLLAFVLSGACAGLAGSLWVIVRGSVGIDTLFVDLSLIIIVMAALGGAGSILGPVAGAYMVIFLQDYLLDEYLLNNLVDEEDRPPVKILIFSLLLLIVLRLQPRGLVVPLLLRRRKTPAAAAGAALEGSHV